MLRVARAFTCPAFGLPTIIPYCCITSGSEAVVSMRPALLSRRRPLDPLSGEMCAPSPRGPERRIVQRRPGGQRTTPPPLLQQATSADPAAPEPLLVEARDHDDIAGLRGVDEPCVAD